jgi:heparan-sulfate lyase
MNDSGCFIYGSDDPEDQAWRSFFRKTENHQTLTLDGKNSRSEPISTEFIERERYSKLKTQNQSYNNLIHERTIWFIDQSYFIIQDRAIGTATGEVRVHFQLNPAPVIIETKKLSVSTQHLDGNNLIVQSFPTEGTQPILNTQNGYISYFINHKEPRTAWNIQLNKKNTETTSFIHALILTKKSDTQPKNISIEGDQLLVELPDEILKLKL